MNNKKTKQPNWPSKVPGKKSGTNRDNNTHKTPDPVKPLAPVKKKK